MKITVKTDKPVAIDSADHIDPFGCKLNSSRNSKFNEKLYKVIPKNANILDVGCAGGGFIEDCINDGYLGVGLEGSDYPMRNHLFSWPKLGNINLFTADATQPFSVVNNDKQVTFDVITAWEFMEHIKESDLDVLFANFINHLTDGGIIIVSINCASEKHKDTIRDDFGIGMHHQNVQSPEWWDTKILEYGLINRFDLLDYFKPDFIRGPGFGCDARATEERYNTTSIIQEQWCTLNRVWSKE